MSDDWLKVFMRLALLGFGLSVAAHVLALTGIVPPLPQPMFVFALHAGIFIVFVPAVLISRQRAQGGARTNLNDIARGSPLWIGALLLLLFAYAVVNFVLVFSLDNAPRGTALTGNEFLKTLRGFSGHWMLFYFASFAMLRAALHPSDAPTDPGADPLSWWNRPFGGFGGD
ncbi:MAG TPA: hypothetical protein VII35_03035 [Steroidobacteraceae bacterium]